MYKLLLCWRYLRTRYIALASIISVTLGVATMIVVNSVMAGFSQRDAGPHPRHPLGRHGRESRRRGLCRRRRGHMEQDPRSGRRLHRRHDAHVAVPAMLSFHVQRQLAPAASHADRHRSATYGSSQRFQSLSAASGKSPAGSSSTCAKAATTRSITRAVPMLRAAPHGRRRLAKSTAWARFYRDMDSRGADHGPGTRSARCRSSPPEELEEAGWIFERGEPLTAEEVAAEDAGSDFDPATETHTGIVLGMALASYRLHDGSDQFFLLPGDDVKLTVPTAGTPPKVAPATVHDRRLLREQNERIRLQLRFRSARIGAARCGTCIDPETGIGARHVDPDQAAARGRWRPGPRPAAGGVSRPSSTP